MLSQRASQMRVTYDEFDLQPLQQFSEGKEELLARYGPGGLITDDLELIQAIGQLKFEKVQGVSQQRSSLQSLFQNSFDFDKQDKNENQKPSIIVYNAIYQTGIPYQSPVSVILKEYVPWEIQLATNEIQTLSKLFPMPQNIYKYCMESQYLSSEVPIIPMLGFVNARTTDMAAIHDAKQIYGNESIYIVYQWKGLAPLPLLLQQIQETFLRESKNSQTYLQILFKDIFPKAQQQEKLLSKVKRSIKNILYGCLNAINFCHINGVCHGSLSKGTFFGANIYSNSLEQVVLKVDNFGFSRLYQIDDTQKTLLESFSKQQQDKMLQVWIKNKDSAYILDCKNDTRSLGFLFLEIITELLTNASVLNLLGQEKTDKQKLQQDEQSDEQRDQMTFQVIKRQLEQIFNRDVDEFRQYLSQDQKFKHVIEFLDEQNSAGWQIMNDLINGKCPPCVLMDNKFFKHDY